MRISSLFWVLLALACFACDDNTAQDETRNQLLGRWELVEAYRNNRLTPSLENLFFEFLTVDTMRTNLNNGRTETLYYEVDEQQIIPQGGSLDAIYQIINLTDDNLELRTTISNLPFKFILRKEMTEDGNI